MKISLIREFITLSQNLNFSKTAQQLFITQSVLSKHIALLEEEVGASLFKRNYHAVELTAIGKLFLAEAIVIVNQYDKGMKKIKLELEESGKELKIGYLHEHTRNILIPSIQLLKKKFPLIKLTLMAGLYGELPQKLKNSDVDVILSLNLDKDIPTWCYTYVLYKDVLCAAVCNSHPLANHKSIEIHELDSENILLPSIENFKGYALFLNEIFNSESLSQPKIARYECIYSSLLMSEAGEGIAIIPRALKAEPGEKVSLIPLKGDQYSFDVIAAWRKTDDNPAIKKFIQTLSHCQISESI